MKEAIENKYEKLKDQFTTPTRNVRRNLLVSASLSIIMLVVGTKIDSIFGVKFKEEVPIYIPIGALSVVVLYEFISFISYAFTDYTSWKLKPYEKTYIFTEKRLAEITGDLKSSINNLNLQNIEGLNDVTPTKFVEFKIESTPYGPLIDPVIFHEELQSGINNGTSTIHPSHRDIEEKFRSEIEVKAEKRINELVQGKTEELNNLIKSEANKHVEELNSTLNDARIAIESNLESFTSATDNIADFINSYENNIKDYYQEVKSFNFFQWIKIYPIDIVIPLLLGVFSLFLTYEQTIQFSMKLLKILVKP